MGCAHQRNKWKYVRNEYSEQYNSQTDLPSAIIQKFVFNCDCGKIICVSFSSNDLSTREYIENIRNDFRRTDVDKKSHFDFNRKDLPPEIVLNMLVT